MSEVNDDLTLHDATMGICVVSDLILQIVTLISQMNSSHEDRMLLRRTLLACDEVLQEIKHGLIMYEIPFTVADHIEVDFGPLSCLFLGLHPVKMVLEAWPCFREEPQVWRLSQNTVRLIDSFIKIQTSRLPNKPLFYTSLAIESIDQSELQVTMLLNRLQGEFRDLNLPTKTEPERFRQALDRAEVVRFGVQKYQDKCDEADGGRLAYENLVCSQFTVPCTMAYPVKQPNLHNVFDSLMNKVKKGLQEGEHNHLTQPSTDARHSFGLAALGLLAAGDLDTGKCVMLGACQDLVGSIAQDLSADGNSHKEDKCPIGLSISEQVALCFWKYNPKAAQGLFSLWLEYEHSLTAEACFMRYQQSLRSGYERQSEVVSGGQQGFVIFIIGDACISQNQWNSWSTESRFSSLCREYRYWSPLVVSAAQAEGFVQQGGSPQPQPRWLDAHALALDMKQVKEDGTWSLVYEFPQTMQHIVDFQRVAQIEHYSIIVDRPPQYVGSQETGYQVFPEPAVLQYLRMGGERCKEVQPGEDFDARMQEALSQILRQAGRE